MISALNKTQEQIQSTYLFEIYLTKTPCNLFFRCLACKMQKLVNVVKQQYRGLI